jgi:hypothetical protein
MGKSVGRSSYDVISGTISDFARRRWEKSWKPSDPRCLGQELNPGISWIGIKIKFNVFHIRELYHIKENNHKHMHNVYCYIHYKYLLHVSTPPDHLQGEQFLYTMAALT